MKRRKFLGLFGGAVTAPFLPMPALATTATKAAPYSAAALHGAIYHAQSRAVFSVWGLAKTLTLPIDSAEVLMGDLAKRGVIGPLQGTTFGGRWASSKIMKSETLALQRAARNGRATNKTSLTETKERMGEPDLAAFLAHLRQLCQSAGMTLSPRCATL